MTMTNKEYKAAREAAQQAEELYTFEHWNGFSYRPSYYMNSDDLKEIRQEYKAIRNSLKAFTLEEFGGRALIIPVEDGFILQSYYTKVAVFRNGEFYKTWNGFSVTTLKHINAFREWLGLDTMSKREWIETEEQ